MKKSLSIFIICLVALFCFSATIQDMQKAIIAHKNAQTCDTSTHVCGTVDNGDQNFGQYSTSDWLATQFVKSGTETICRVDLRLKDAGTPTGNITVYIYSDDAGSPPHPDSLVSGCTSDPVSGVVGDVYVSVEFPNLDCTLSDGVTYWVVGYYDDANSSNYPIWGKTWTGCSTLRYDVSGDGVSWSNLSTSIALEFILYTE